MSELSDLIFCSLCRGRSLDDPEEEFTHEKCAEMMTEDDQLSVRIYLAYHRQGDDLTRFSVDTEGVLDPYKSFENLAWHLGEVSKNIKLISAALKEEVKKLRDQLFLLKDKVETHEKSENAHNKYRAWG